jgi:hypothetical protein
MDASFYLVKDFADGVDDQDSVMPATLYRWEINLSELFAIEAQAWEDYPGFQIEVDYNSDDPYQGDLPPVYLPAPTSLGQIAYKIQRSVRVWVRNPISGSTETYWDTHYWQWFDSVAI